MGQLTKPQVRRDDLIEPDLSYKIVGVILDVFHELGPGLKEVVYQKAVMAALVAGGLKFQRELFCPIRYKGLAVGRRYLDFLIEDKIVVELKCSDRFLRPHIMQVKEYLELMKLPLGIIAAIDQSGVSFKRVVNAPTPRS